MKVVRIVLYVIGGFLTIIGVIIGVVFYATQGPVVAADRFFEAVAKSGPAAAYATAAPGFRSAVPADAFAALAGQLGLERYQSASWPSRSIEGGRSELEGTLTLTDGGVVAIKLVLIKGAGGDWQILSMNVERGGVTIRKVEFVTRSYVA